MNCKDCKELSCNDGIHICPLGEDALREEEDKDGK